MARYIVTLTVEADHSYDNRPHWLAEDVAKAVTEASSQDALRVIAAEAEAAND